MNFDLLASRRQLAAVALVVCTLLPLSNCGGGTDQHASDTASTSSPAPAPTPTPVIEPTQPLPGEPQWGVAPSSTLTRNPEAWLPAMAQAGITTVRNFQDVPGEDKLTPILAAGMSAVGILQWTNGTTITLPVDDLAGWQRYVTDEVGRHQGRVQYWEMWNEPPNFTQDKSPGSYAKVVAAAYDAAKAVDPTVQLGLSAKSNHVNWLAESIAAGAAGKFDFITLHPYEVAELLPQGWEGQFMSIVPRVRRMLQLLDPAKASVPIWFTEIGISAAPPPGRGNVGPLVQADVLVKIYTMAFAQGVSRVYWFDPSDSEGLSMGLATADGAKRPAWHAMRTLQTYLGAQPRYAGWVQPSGAWYGFVYDGPQGVVLSAWTRSGETLPLALASEVLAVDPRSDAGSATRAPTLSDSPSILVAPRDSAQALQWLAEAHANKGKPFAWNGDHSAASSVEMTAGEVPNGVFMVNPPAVSTFDSAAEFDVQGGIGACFAVDPTFLQYAYAATPVRITAQVRGHGTGDPGFELKYESTAPIADTDTNNLAGVSSGWYRVGGSSLQEKSWLLTDARFVGLYGYNFCFYAPHLENAEFSIRKVTVQR